MTDERKKLHGVAHGVACVITLAYHLEFGHLPGRMTNVLRSFMLNVKPFYMLTLTLLDSRDSRTGPVAQRLLVEIQHTVCRQSLGIPLQRSRAAAAEEG